MREWECGDQHFIFEDNGTFRMNDVSDPKSIDTWTVRSDEWTALSLTSCPRRYRLCFLRFENGFGVPHMRFEDLSLEDAYSIFCSIKDMEIHKDKTYDISV